MQSAPRDGTKIKLRGSYPFRAYATTPEKKVVTGQYETGGYTEGWIDMRGNEFWPEEWKPLKPSDE